MYKEIRTVSGDRVTESGSGDEVGEVEADASAANRGGQVLDRGGGDEIVRLLVQDENVAMRVRSCRGVRASVRSESLPRMSVRNDHILHSNRDARRLNC